MIAFTSNITMKFANTLNLGSCTIYFARERLRAPGLALFYLRICLPPQ